MSTQIKLETVSTIQKKFIINVPAQAVGEKISKKFAEVQRTAKLKGFREGKVPLNLVKQFYADDVKNRVLRNLVDETYREALVQNPIRVVGEPVIQGAKEADHLHIHDGEDFSFVALVDVIPEIEPKDYKGLSLQKESIEVTKEDLDKLKANLLDRRATLKPVDRKSKTGDTVDFKYEGRLNVDGNWTMQTNLSGERNVELGSGQLLPEFEKNVVGLKAGEEKVFEFAYAADYNDQTLAGKTAQYEVHMREVKEKELPEFNDEFVKEFGYENIADFETKSREYLAEGKKEESENKLRNSMIEKLIEKNKFEVPQSLVMAQVRALAEDYAAELRRYGFNDQMLQTAVMSQLESFQKRADQQVRAGILLDAIAKKESITPTQENIDQEAALAAPAFGQSVEEFKKRLAKSPRERSNFEFRVREEMTIKLILDSAKIKS